MKLMSNQTVRVGPLEIDHRRRTAAVGEADLYLSPHEFDLLSKLAEDPERLVPIDELLGDTFAEAIGVTRQTVESYADRVKRKLDLRGMPNVLHGESGIGLRLLGAPGNDMPSEGGTSALREVA